MAAKLNVREKCQKGRERARVRKDHHTVLVPPDYRKRPSL